MTIIEHTRPNIENGGSRINDELETFTSTLMGMSHGVSRGYVYYQTCKRCKAHECVIVVDPLMWHRKENSTTSPQFLPTLDSSISFANRTGLLYATANLEWCPNGTLFVNGDEFDAPMDFAYKLWNVHCHHAARCGASLNDPVHRNGMAEWNRRVENGTVDINDLFRVVNGVAHTDTDLLLVNPNGEPLLIIEDYHQGRDKYISFSKSLSRQSGGVFVAKVRVDDNQPPLIEELWDMRDGTQLVNPSQNVRGYSALGQILVNHPVWQPYLRQYPASCRDTYAASWTSSQTTGRAPMPA